MDINHIAKLSRIKLAGKEKKKLEKDISAVLDFFGKLQELNTEKVDPIAHITGLENVMRKDRAVKTDEKTRQRLLDSAPETQDGYVKVKSVL